ncbi:MAG: sensor histidine kinase [Hyphomicrobiales bacterium]
MKEVLNNIIHKAKSELWFSLLIIISIFLYTNLDEDHFHIETYEILFFLNYILAGLIINYILLPKFFYKKKYFFFFTGLVLTIALTIVIEEFVLEKIYFPYTRGATFPPIIYSLIDVMPVILLMVGAKFAWDAKNSQVELEQLKSAKVESELQMLKSQINPHFLFNNLNNLYAYALEQSPKTPNLILQLSALLRYMLYEATDTYVNLKKEINYLSDYIQLNQLQIEDRGEINFETNGSLEGKIIAPFILVVFIENCFKHSTSSQTENIKIDINIDVYDNVLRLHCSNTFTNINNKDNLASGIGLKNVKSRLELLYPENYTLEINNHNNIYDVILELNLMKS